MDNVARAFSLIELLITLITISCITAAFAPVITKKMSSSQIVINQPQEKNKQEEISSILEAMKDCKFNEDKTKLICEIDVQEIEKNNSNDVVTNGNITKVEYSKRRDKIRFDNREEGNYTTTSITKGPLTINIEPSEIDKMNDIILNNEIEEEQIGE